MAFVLARPEANGARNPRTAVMRISSRGSSGLATYLACTISGPLCDDLGWKSGDRLVITTAMTDGRASLFAILSKDGRGVALCRASRKGADHGRGRAVIFYLPIPRWCIEQKSLTAYYADWNRFVDGLQLFAPPEMHRDERPSKPSQVYGVKPGSSQQVDRGSLQRSRSDILMPILKDACERNDYMPANSEMCEALGMVDTFSNRAICSWTVAEMHRRGELVLERQGPPKHSERRVQIDGKYSLWTGHGTTIMTRGAFGGGGRFFSDSLVDLAYQKGGAYEDMPPLSAEEESARIERLVPKYEPPALVEADRSQRKAYERLMVYGPAPTCQWIERGPISAPTFCGEQSKAGSSYCAHHHGSVYVPRTPLKPGTVTYLSNVDRARR